MVTTKIWPKVMEHAQGKECSYVHRRAHPCGSPIVCTHASKYQGKWKKQSKKPSGVTNGCIPIGELLGAGKLYAHMLPKIISALALAWLVHED